MENVMLWNLGHVVRGGVLAPGCKRTLERVLQQMGSGVGAKARRARAGMDSLRAERFDWLRDDIRAVFGVSP